MWDFYGNRRHEMGLSSEASDRLPANADQITDEQLGIPINILPDPNGQATPTRRRHTAVLMLRLQMANTSWLYEIYLWYHFNEIMNYYDQYYRRIYNYYAIYTVAALLGYFDADRDAQAEGRTAHPVEDAWQFSATVEVVIDEDPFGIPDTQPHDAEVLPRLDDNQPIHVFPTDDDNNNGGPTDQTGANALVLNNGDLPAAAADNMNRNINPLNLIEPHDNLTVDNTNQAQLPTMTSGNDANTNVLAAAGRQEPDRTLSNNDTIDNNNAKNNQQVQKPAVHGTGTVRQQNEATESRNNFATPIFNPEQTIDGIECTIPRLN